MFNMVLLINILFFSALFFIAYRLIKLLFYFRKSLLIKAHSYDLSQMTVIVPIFGFDNDVKENIPLYLSLAKCNVDIKWIFCLSFRDSSSFEYISNRISFQSNCIVVISPEDYSTSDKNLNMITGIENSSTDKIVFIDVDNKISGNFLRNFSMLLEKYDSVTSYSFYVSDLKRSVWWASDISDFLRKSPRYIWGGAMGFSFRRIHKNELTKVLRVNIHDDIPLSKYLDSNSLLTCFDGNSFGISDGGNHPETFFAWTLRLSTFGKYGLGRIWELWLVGHLIRIIVLCLLIYYDIILFFVMVLCFGLYYYIKYLICYYFARRNNEIQIKSNYLISFIYSIFMQFYEPLINLFALFNKKIIYRNVTYRNQKKDTY